LAERETVPEADRLAAVRAACMALPEVTERPSHGGPAWFVRDRRSFVMYMDNHHGDGRLALWCAAPEGVQAAMVEARPGAYFVPPYVGHRGWLGVRLDRDLAWADVAYAISDAYHAVSASGRGGGPRR
jgi:hypothetical protein